MGTGLKGVYAGCHTRWRGLESHLLYLFHLPPYDCALWHCCACMVHVLYVTVDPHTEWQVFIYSGD